MTQASVLGMVAGGSQSAQSFRILVGPAESIFLQSLVILPPGRRGGGEVEGPLPLANRVEIINLGPIALAATAV